MICTLLFFGIYGTYKPLQERSELQITKNFDSYLSGALARNTLPEKRYQVVFYREDFVDTSLDTPNSPAGNNFDTSLGFQNNSQDSYQITTGQEDIIASSRGNFGTPEINILPDGAVNPNCHGIVYDPCIMMKDYNNGLGNMYLGTTRIYEFPSEI